MIISVTSIDTVAELEGSFPSVAMYVNESTPVNPAGGVYVTSLTLFVTVPRVPVVSIESTVSGLLSASVSFCNTSNTLFAEFSGTLKESFIAIGGIFGNGGPACPSSTLISIRFVS